MPVYAMICPKGHAFDHFAPMKDAPRAVPCEECGVPAKQDYQAKSPQVGMIDGEQTGYFPPEAGPYANPGKSIKRVLKNNDAWREMVKRSEGKIGDVS